MVDLELSTQLEDLHLLVDLEVAVLAAHATIEELIEVDEAVVTLDTHLEKLLFELTIIVELFSEPQACLFVPFFSEFPEEFLQLLLLDLEALVSILSKYFPSLHKVRLIFFEKGDHVLCGQIIFFELLDDDQNKQVKHDMAANEDD